MLGYEAQKRKFHDLKYVYPGTQESWSSFDFLLKANLESNCLSEHILRSRLDLKTAIESKPERKDPLNKGKKQSVPEAKVYHDLQVSKELELMQYSNGWVLMTILNCLNEKTRLLLQQLPVLDPFHVYQKLKQQHVGTTMISTQFLLKRLMSLFLSGEKSNSIVHFKQLLFLTWLCICRRSWQSVRNLFPMG
jgi:hypothetical protein